MTSLIALCLLAPSASDYFPLQPGTRWHYREEGSGAELVDSVEAAVEIRGFKATPILSEGKFSTYFVVDGDTVYRVASDPKYPLEPPMPVLKVGERKMEWTYDSFNSSPPIRMKCTSEPKGQRDVLGKKVAVIEVRTDATFGDPKRGMKSRQVALYGEGLGLVHLTEELTLGKENHKRSMELVKFEPAAVGP